MQITFTIDTHGLVAGGLEHRILRILLGDEEASPSPSETSGGTKAPARAKKAAETPSEPEETPASAGLDPDLMAEATEKALALVRGKGKGPGRVKAALDDIGFEKVTAIDNNDALRQFLEAVS